MHFTLPWSEFSTYIIMIFIEIQKYFTLRKIFFFVVSNQHK